MHTHNQDEPELSLRERIDTSLQSAEAALEAGEGSPERVATLRLVMCALRDRDLHAQEATAESRCPEAEVRQVLERLAAQRREAAAALPEGEAEDELAELAVIHEFLPKPLEGPVLTKAVEEVVRDLDAHKLKDTGRCMKMLKSRYPDRIESGPAYKTLRDVIMHPEDHPEAATPPAG